jgi:hypothetical protein
MILSGERGEVLWKNLNTVTVKRTNKTLIDGTV